jgi:hypothetical protein
MSLISRSFSSFVLLSALLSSFLCLAADKLIDLGIVTDQFGNRVSLLDLERTGDRMACETQSSLARCRSKDKIADSLIHGDLPLLEAAALYRSLYDDPRSWRHPQRPRPGHEDGETWCREVIEWTVTKVYMEKSPSEAKTLQRRLQAELQDLLNSHSTLELAE